MEISDMSISGDDVFISDVVIRLRSVSFMVPVTTATGKPLPN